MMTVPRHPRASPVRRYKNAGALAIMSRVDMFPPSPPSMHVNHAAPGSHRETWKASVSLILTAFPFHRFREAAFVPELPLDSWSGPNGLACALSVVLEGFARGYERWTPELEAWCVVMLRWFHASCPRDVLRVPIDLVRGFGCPAPPHPNTDPVVSRPSLTRGTGGSSDFISWWSRNSSRRGPWSVRTELARSLLA
jgi:hypothetical protein